MDRNEWYNRINEAEAPVAALPAIMRKVYTWMVLALVITAITSYGVANNASMMYAIFSSRWMFYGIIFAELALVVWLSSRLFNMSMTMGTVLFIIYSILNGVLLSVIFYTYSPAIIGKTFLVCAGTFGVMTAYGSLTRTDLSSMGSIVSMGVVGLLIAMVVNLFLHSSGLDMVISIVGVLVFVGLTAWDTQKLRVMLSHMDYLDDTTQKVALMGALSLYLDFINMFLFLLRLFGGRK